MCKRARPDVQPTMAAPCARVKAPGEKDWNKSVRMNKHSHSMKKDTLTLDAGKGVHDVEWSMDSAFGAHPDFKSHAGATMKFKEGHGSVVNLSAKQKLNTESSTVAELVGVDHALPLVLWAPLFLKEQGYKVKENAVKQDNKSTTLLAKNGKTSSGKRTRAINIRYFCITDQIKWGNVSMEYCPTDEMTSDYMSKGLQGIKFRKFRHRIMGFNGEEPH